MFYSIIAGFFLGITFGAFMEATTKLPYKGFFVPVRGFQVAVIALGTIVALSPVHPGVHLVAALLAAFVGGMVFYVASWEVFCFVAERVNPIKTSVEPADEAKTLDRYFAEAKWRKVHSAHHRQVATRPGHNIPGWRFQP